jgi:hypothetical protein
VKQVPLSDFGAQPASDRCCFCGESVRDARRIRLDARWVDAGEERTQSWDAHQECLVRLMHDSVHGVGPFFDE